MSKRIDELTDEDYDIIEEALASYLGDLNHRAAFGLKGSARKLARAERTERRVRAIHERLIGVTR